jgi:hypothetical protein
VEKIAMKMHKLTKIIDAVNNGSEALIGCFVLAFTSKFLATNVPKKTSDRSMINIFSVIFPY